MDPVSSILTGHAAGKVLDRVADKFRTQVIERWSRKRAEQFFTAFAAQVAQDRNLLNDANVELSLEHILSEDMATEVLFEAYRRVALSRSRKLGPRMVGLLAARLVAEGRFASEDEETMFSVAETCFDDDLRAFVQFFDDERSKVSDTTRGDDTVENSEGLKIHVDEEQFDSNWRLNEPRSTGPLDLRACYGAWAARLGDLGVLIQDVREREFAYDVDSERHVDEPGTVRAISWTLLVPRVFFPLVELIKRADWEDVTWEQSGASKGE